jgi:hypothetical protein
VDPDAWKTYGPKPYVTFSPQPSALDQSSYSLTSTLPAVALQNRAVFGDSGGAFADSWMRFPPGGSFETTHLNLWIDSTLCMGGAFEPTQVVDRLESFSFEKLDPYGGFDLYAGTASGISLQVIGLNEEWLLMDFPADISEGQRHVRSLIDLYQGESTPYYRSNDAFTSMVEYLPQGVFTRVYPEISTLDLRLPTKPLETAGETLLLDDQQTPATGVIVLRMEEDVTDPKRVVEESFDIMTSFMTLSLQTPEIRLRGDRTVILNAAVDPETVFGA